MIFKKILNKIIKWQILKNWLEEVNALFYCTPLDLRLDFVPGVCGLAVFCVFRLCNNVQHGSEHEPDKLIIYPKQRYVYILYNL